MDENNVVGLPRPGGIVDDERGDSVSISPDRTLIAHGRTLKEGAWCVRIWDAHTGQYLSETMLRETFAATVQALTPNMFVLADSWNGVLGNAELRVVNGSGFSICHCRSNPVKFLSLEARVDSLMTDPSTRLTACASKNRLVVLGGAVFQPLEDYRGHKGHVNAVWIDGSDRLLWSGGKDGTIRRWSIPDTPPFDHNLEPVVPAVTDGNHVASLFRDEDGDLYIQAFNGQGSPVSPCIPFTPVSSPNQNDWEPYRAMPLRNTINRPSLFSAAMRNRYWKSMIQTSPKSKNNFSRSTLSLSAFRMKIVPLMASTPGTLIRVGFEHSFNSSLRTRSKTYLTLEAHSQQRVRRQRFKADRSLLRRILEVRTRACSFWGKRDRTQTPRPQSH